MQANYSEYASGFAAMGGVYTLCHVAVAKLSAGIPGPVQSLRRGLTHLQAAGSLIVVIACKAVREFAERYPEALKSKKEQW